MPTKLPFVLADRRHPWRMEGENLHAVDVENNVFAKFIRKYEYPAHRRRHLTFTLRDQHCNVRTAFRKNRKKA
ncbi:MAG: hypothetical protein LBB62_05990 [Proteiniphilum sp.]|nr:hypothetical protein [Proteiniphilum sp.]